MKSVDRIKNNNVKLTAPPSKAHTLRALIIGSLAKGETIIQNPLFGQDQLNVIECLKGLGVSISVESDKIIVQGTTGNINPIAEELNVGESGVGMNSLSSVCCLSKKPIILTGAKRITERPVGEIVNGLIQLGCEIDYLQQDGFPPMKIHGGSIKGGLAKMSGAKSSQYFSSLAIAAPYAENQVTIECVDDMTEKPYFDITLQMMSDFGVVAKNENFKNIIIPNSNKYIGRPIQIEGDYSSASFFFLAAAISKAKIEITNLRHDTKQGDCQFIDFLARMGCVVNEIDGGFILQGTGLKPIEQDMSNVPDLVPPMAIAAAFAKGTSRLTNIGHLRHKECDRLEVMATELQKMGVNAQCDDYSLTIEGTDKAHGTQIDPHNDHRIAMSFAVAGLVTGNQIIENEMCVSKSFPDFWERFEIFTK